MSNNMYETYDDCKFRYYSPSDFDHRTREYLLPRYTPKAVWDYDDTLSIVFNLVECPEIDDSILDSLEGKYVRVNFYNFRYEQLPFEYEAEALKTFTVDIDYETSKKYFNRGIYNCSVKLFTYNEIEDENGELIKVVEESITLLPREYCSFYVQ